MPLLGLSARLGVVALVAAVSGCALSGRADDGDGSTPSRTVDPAPSVLAEEIGSAAPIVVAAGDIARTGNDAARATASLIQSMRPDAVLALGDNAYEDGSLGEYRNNYDPTWGRFKSITRPVPGNHDYGTGNAAGYYRYFASQIHGDQYYAWNAGRWRMYALNCEVDCGSGSEQLAWLQADLTTHPRRPALAYVHEPRFTCSTRHPPETELSAVWSALQGGRGRIMLAAHNHAYERFAKLDAQGRRDPDGLRLFVVGTGGAGLYPLKESCPNRQAAQDDEHGVLKLRLGTKRFSWKFITINDRVLDKGRGQV